MITFDLTNQRFLFVTNPKSGVTTTHHVLANVLHEDFKRYDELGSHAIIKNKQTAFIFRNPYERAVSMFFRFNRVLWTDPTGVRGSVTTAILEKYGKEDGFDFLDFLTFLQDTRDEERDVHYRSQDIPSKYDFLILTRRYQRDMLSFFDHVGYKKGVEVLSCRTAASVIANNIKKNEEENKEWGNVFLLKTFAFETFEESGYPPYDLFLDPVTRKLIEDIFREEVQLHHSVQNTRTDVDIDAGRR